MVCAIGELLIDFIQNGENEFSFPVLSAVPGGAPANFLCAVKKQGIDAAFIGKVGKDAFGKKLKGVLQEKGINVKGVIEDKNVFTTLAFVTLGKDGERSFSFARNPGADTCLNFEEIDLSVIDRCSVFHFGSLSFTDEPSKTAVIKAAEYAKAQGKLISYDPNYRPPLWKSEKEARENMLLGMKYADIVKLSGEEGEFIFGTSPEATARKLICEYGCSIVFVTLGKDGCFYKSQNGEGFTASETGVTPIDTTGAGDIFGGTAVSLILKSGKPVDELTAAELHCIAKNACTVASESTEQYGGML